MKNKTDRELLEMAAKACGYDTSHKWNSLRMEILRMEMTPPVFGLVVKGVSTNWNPIDFDEHAFRLAVKLKLRIDHVYREQQRVMVGDGEYWAIVPYNGDPYAATRRAIVMAAAKFAEGRHGY